MFTTISVAVVSFSFLFHEKPHKVIVLMSIQLEADEPALPLKNAMG